MLVFAAVTPLPAQEQHRTFKVPFHNVDGLILLEVGVGGKPAVFLLDTGASISLFRRASRSHGTINIMLDPACTGCVYNVEVKELSSLGVNRNQELDKAVGGIDGILGETFLRGFRSFRVDYKNHVLELEQ